MFDGSRQIGPQAIFVANWAPADWAPWRQIGPLEILLRQIGPRQIGPQDNLDAVNCIYPIQIYIYWGKHVSWYWLYSANNWGRHVC